MWLWEMAVIDLNTFGKARFVFAAPVCRKVKSGDAALVCWQGTLLVDDRN